MSRRIHYLTFGTMTLICFLAFVLRLWDISITDYDLDESWTYNQVFYTQSSGTFNQIYREPNNILHILTVTPLASAVPQKIGYRFWSIAAGMLSVAVVGRLAFRLFGRDAAWIAALITAFSYYVIDLSQHVRPYMIANLFGVLALLMWVERRNRLNMLFSALTPLFHIGAFPVVMIQDVVLFWGILRKRYVNMTDWVLSRIPAYTMLLLVVSLVFARRQMGENISGVLPVPTFLDLLNNWKFNTHGDGSSLSNLFFWIATLLCFVASIFIYRSSGKFKAEIAIPILWIALTYGMLITTTIFSQAATRYIHISHIAFATALLFAAGLVQTPPIVRYGLLTVLLLANIMSLIPFYSKPFQEYTNSFQALQAWHEDGQRVVYFKTLYPIQALILAAPIDADLTWLIYVNSVDATLPSTPYVYLAYSVFDPPLFPNECDTQPIWEYWLFHLHECNP